MKFNLVNVAPIYTARLMAYFISSLLVIMLSACGGGNGPAGTPVGGGQGGTSGKAKIILAFNPPTAVIPLTRNMVVGATVLDKNGDKVALASVQYTIVTSSGDASPGTFSPGPCSSTTCSAVTSSNGAAATVILLPGAPGVAGTLNVSAIFTDSEGVTDTITNNGTGFSTATS